MIEPLPRPHPRRRTIRAALATALAAAGALATPPPVRAHEIPRDVTVRAFVRPAGDVLRLVIRVPVEALRDIEFPTRDGVYLDVAAARPLLARAATLWIGDYVRFYENGEPLPPGRLAAARVSLPSDPSFASYDQALAHTRDTASTADPTDLPWRQAVLDALFEYRIGSDSARFAVEPAWAHLGLRTLTVLWFSPADGPARAFQYTGDPGLVHLDPSWIQAAWRFVALGFDHILDGLDHLLFLLCLVLPCRRVRTLIPVVTAFTVAHSITLAAAALGLAPDALWFPPLIEVLIALSIVYMAIENVIGANVRRRWVLAFGFGLVHGFGFSFALSESLQFAGGHLLSALFAFNVGVELGQLLVVAIAAPLLALLFRRVVKERIGVVVASVLVGHTAWHWMVDRWRDLARFDLRWPRPAADDLLRWLALLLIVSGAAWLLGLGFDRLARRAPAERAAR